MPQFYTVRQVVQFAIALEQASQEFYRRLADYAEALPVRAFIMRLVGEESLHEKALRNAIDAHAESLLASTVSEQEVAAYIQAVKVPAPLDYTSAVRMARDKENASRMLYSILASSAENPVLEDLFLFLEKQEIEHHAYFEREYARLRIGQN